MTHSIPTANQPAPEAFDVIVIGGGHAGTEAALAAARMGAKTLLLTQNIETIGQMSCNPAIGGIGKSHLVAEIDALDGVMAKAADAAGIHIRTLNSSKGPAVHATRAQTDRALYKQAVRRFVENQPNLSVFQGSVVDLMVENGRACGVVTELGLQVRGETVVLTTGTFLGGKIHIGMEHHAGGRAGDAPANALAERLRKLPFRVNRLKTGTPPRIDGKSVNFAVMETQAGDNPLPWMSQILEHVTRPTQVNCFITYTNETTHDIIRQGLDRSPLFTGEIDGVGPRYCPSIEDKVDRFSDRLRHQIFVEPEGLNTTELYPNGISTSLPFDVQVALVRSIQGFEKAHITRPGYAIEYDFFDPRDLNYSLETKAISNLFFAGQINGTTGYEEAAAQGLLAGINAARKVAGQASWCPARDEAYIGVLVDDLVTLGTNEPYRMFTSRAEYRLRLRQDNADQRLAQVGYDLGVVSRARLDLCKVKYQAVATLAKFVQNFNFSPDSALGQALAQATGESFSKEGTLETLLRRPKVDLQQIASVVELPSTQANILEKVAIDVKYAGYIKRQETEIQRVRKLKSVTLAKTFDYSVVDGLSNELLQKLTETKPTSLANASRIPGMTPAALSLLLVYAKRANQQQAS